MRPASPSAARPLVLCLAMITGACGGSTAARPTEVDLGRAPGDPESKIADADDDDDAAAREKRVEQRLRVSKEPPEEPGYLTLICDPACDEVSHEGTSLGPSPVVRVPLAPGSRRITVSNGGVGHKIITVIMRSGETTALRINMGVGPAGSAPPPALGSSSTAQPGMITVNPAPPPAMVQQRAQLEPKAWAGKATLDEIRLLRAICSYMADRACRDRAAALLKAQVAAPPPNSP